MKSKRFFSMLLAVLSMAGLMAACGGGDTASDSKADSSAGSTASKEADSKADDSSEADDKADSEAEGSDEVYTINFYAWTAPENVVQLLDEFNKEYEGKYVMEYQKLADAATMTINTALASGESIDVMTQANAFDLRTRYDGGTYLGLNQFLEKDGENYKEIFGDTFDKVYNFEDDYYAVPYCNNQFMMFFNKKMFDEAGEPYPEPDWTWDDFREKAERLTSGEGANKVYGAMIDFGKPDVDMFWAGIAQQKLGEFWYYNDDFTATKFDAPEMKESLDFFYNLSNDGFIVPLDEYTALQYDSDTVAMNGLYSDKFAMYACPVYGCLYLNENYGEVPEGTDIGMTNIPRPADVENPTTITYSSTASIPTSSKNPEAAWTALRYICIDHAELFDGPKANLPAYSFKTEEEANDFYDIVFSGHPGLDYDMCMEIMALPRDQVSKDNTIVQGQMKIKELINANIPMVFNGEMTVDEALADFKEKGDQFIADDLG